LIHRVIHELRDGKRNGLGSCKTFLRQANVNVVLDRKALSGISVSVPWSVQQPLVNEEGASGALPYFDA
jgi:hypothetical protein